jgi:hypothetical protein
MPEANVFSSRSALMLPAGPIATICQSDQANQQLSSANRGEVRQNPQHSRNKAEWDFEEDTLP